MMCKVDWPLVVELLKALPALVVAAAVAVIAFQQWKTAQNKLALDLFDKRFSARQRINDLIAKRSGESVHEVDEVLGVYHTEISDQLDREICEARFLFGEEAFQKMVLVSEALEAVVRFNTKLDREKWRLLDDPALDSLYEDRSNARKHMSQAKQEVEALLEPYLMIDMISVNRPKRQFR